MTEPSKDFSGLGFDLAIGEVYGLRVWRMDSYGRLRAVHVASAAPWRPGVNTAACHLPDYLQFSGMTHFARALLNSGGVIATASVSPEPEPEQEQQAHEAPDEQCKCGFYAYTCPTAETYAGGADEVLGVIRGTGRTLLGAKGFRCEKAEILALLDPACAQDPGPFAQWLRDRLRVVYPDVPLLRSRTELLGFAPIEQTTPAPSTDEFWSLP